MIVKTEPARIIVVKVNNNGWTNVEALGDNSTFKTSFKDNPGLSQKAEVLRGKDAVLTLDATQKNDGSAYFNLVDISEENGKK